MADMHRACSRRLWCGLNVVSHIAQPPEQMAGAATMIETVEIGCPQLPVVGSGGEHTVGTHQDLMADGDGGPPRTPPRPQAAMLVGKVTAAGAAAGNGGGDKADLRWTLPLRVLPPRRLPALS